MLGLAARAGQDDVRQSADLEPAIVQRHAQARSQQGAQRPVVPGDADLPQWDRCRLWACAHDKSSFKTGSDSASGTNSRFQLTGAPSMRNSVRVRKTTSEAIA